MSPKEAANRWAPGAISSFVVGLILVFIQFAKDDTKAQNAKIDNKADKQYVDEKIEAAKKEIDAKREADYRELKTMIIYIKEGVDELRGK